MKTTRIFHLKFFICFGGKILNIFGQACFRNETLSAICISCKLIYMAFVCTFYKGDSFCCFLFCFPVQEIFLKRGSTLKGKICSHWEHFFPL